VAEEFLDNPIARVALLLHQGKSPALSLNPQLTYTIGQRPRWRRAWSGGLVQLRIMRQRSA